MIMSAVVDHSNLIVTYNAVMPYLTFSTGDPSNSPDCTL